MPGSRREPSGPGRRRGLRRENLAGWLFCAPVIVLLVVFLIVPIVMAAWVSISNWDGIGSPFSQGVKPVGLENYAALLAKPGLSQSNLGESLRNNLYYVLFVVPLQTIIALLLAVMVSKRRLAGRGFFRTAFYFPSITSSVATSVVFMFLFSNAGVVNGLLKFVGANGPQWFSDPRGIFHIGLGALGIHSAPAALAQAGPLGQSWWEWLAGPSVAMMALIFLATWTTSGTFMLIFLPALQSISSDVEDAAVMDGTSSWQRLWYVTIPILRPTIFLVLTLGLIGTWQVFDQVYLLSQGNPAGTTLTPAFLAYQQSFGNQQWGQGAAIAFVLFGIIVVLTIAQRLVLREREVPLRRQLKKLVSPRGRKRP